MKRKRKVADVGQPTSQTNGHATRKRKVADTLNKVSATNGHAKPPNQHGLNSGWTEYPILKSTPRVRSQRASLDQYLLSLALAEREER